MIERLSETELTELQDFESKSKELSVYVEKLKYNEKLYRFISNIYTRYGTKTMNDVLKYLMENHCPIPYELCMVSNIFNYNGQIVYDKSLIFRINKDIIRNDMENVMNAYRKLGLEMKETSYDRLVMTQEKYNEIGELISSCKDDDNKNDSNKDNKIGLSPTDFFILESMVFSYMKEVREREKILGLYHLEVNRILSFIHKYFGPGVFNDIIRMMMNENIEVPYNLLIINGTIFDIDEKTLHDDIDNVVKAYNECVKRNHDDLGKFISSIINK